MRRVRSRGEYADADAGCREVSRREIFPCGSEPEIDEAASTRGAEIDQREDGARLNTTRPLVEGQGPSIFVGVMNAGDADNVPGPRSIGVTHPACCPD
jgi:hypothetical protein